jgi:hypothetical protein
MDIVVAMFYAGGVVALLKRDRSMWQAAFWPFQAGKLVARMLHDYANKDT